MSNHTSSPIQSWGGPEYTLNRVGDRFVDQVQCSGHHARPGDLERFASLKLTALRYPVLWERIAPASLDQPDWQWTDQQLARIRALGMRPIAGLLHHGSGPGYTSLVDPAFPDGLARFARMVAERYPWITDYTPVNEPLTTARFSALYGHWYPHAQDDRAFVRALLNQVCGVVKSMRAIRSVNPDARLIQTEDCGRCYGTTPLGDQVAFENHRRWLTWDLLTGRVDARHPLRGYLVRSGATHAELDLLCDQPTPPQVVGLNYYLTSDRFLDHRLAHYPRETHGSNARTSYADVEAVRVRPEGIHGHDAHLLDAWHRYRLPVALTEVHLACTRDDQLRWLWEAWQGAHAARACGADVVAVTSWSLLGSYDWDSLVTKPRGHYESGAFDVRAPEPRPTALAGLIRELASGTTPTAAALDGPGWWRRPERLLYAGLSAQPAVRSDARPVLVLGASGTLGRAFRRVAEQRGLPMVCVARAAVDVTDGQAVRRLLRQVRPWSVVNTSGYVRVDDAEQDRDACFHVNTTGAATVASACRDLGVALVSFSSDLVFDGAQDHPYTEVDAPRPLNVYGESKAEAERQILEILPGGLVVRTSAFFGPWDEHNFVVKMLDTVSRGHTWTAPDDVVISPTYVPDLVNATLDLLLDRESGIWHLSNVGPVSWYEFARAAAVACGERADLVLPTPGDALGWRAPRPMYSALASVRGQVMPSTDHALAAFASCTDWRSLACA